MVLKSAIPSFIRSTKDHVFHRSQMQAFTELMTGKRDLKSLYAHCAAVGAGVEQLSIRDDGRPAYRAIVDARRQSGLCFSELEGTLVARLDRGRFVGAAPELCLALDAVIAALPPSQALVWTGATRILGPVPDAAALAAHRAREKSSSAAAKEADATKATAKKATAKKADTKKADTKKAAKKATAVAIAEITTKEELTALTATQRAQLTSAAPGLVGKKTLASLFAWLAAEDESVVLVRIDVDGVPRWDGWLLGALEDGVFFEHGKKRPSGLAMSQQDVCDETSKRRDDDVALLQSAMRALRLPRRRR
ncbi:MAG: hypothetical protein K1X94_22845 [Sandaracinaceae bacterium]|nr:hypothetical protein [Sandaracinaceae bacterium]